jgi:hypothetical protein
VAIATAATRNSVEKSLFIICLLETEASVGYYISDPIKIGINPDLVGRKAEIRRFNRKTHGLSVILP